MKSMYLVGLVSVFLACKHPPKETVRFSQWVPVKYAQYLGNGSYQVEVAVKHKDRKMRDYVVITGLLIHHPVKVGEIRNYVEYDRVDENGVKHYSRSDLMN